MKVSIVSFEQCFEYSKQSETKFVSKVVVLFVLWGFLNGRVMTSTRAPKGCNGLGLDKD